MGNVLGEPDVAAGPPGEDGNVVVHSVLEADLLLDNACHRLIIAAALHMADLENAPGLSDEDRNLLVSQATHLWDQLIDLSNQIDHATVEIDSSVRS